MGSDEMCILKDVISDGADYNFHAFLVAIEFLGFWVAGPTTMRPEILLPVI